MPLVTRQYGPNAKNSKLSFYDMDMNLYYLQDIGVSGFSYSNNVFTLTNPTGGTKTINFNEVTGFTVNGILSATTLTVNGVSITGDTFVTGGTFSAGTITFTNNTGSGFDVTGITSTPVVNYTIYKALITLSSGTFTISQLENTIGDGSNTNPNDIEWTNPVNGVLNATKTGAFSNANKISIGVSNINAGGVPYICTAQKATNNIIQVSIFLHDGTQSSTPNFTNLPIEIRIYN